MYKVIYQCVPIKAFTPVSAKVAYRHPLPVASPQITTTMCVALIHTISISTTVFRSNNVFEKAIALCVTRRFVDDRGARGGTAH